MGISPTTICRVWFFCRFLIKALFPEVLLIVDSSPLKNHRTGYFIWKRKKGSDFSEWIKERNELLMAKENPNC